MMKNCSKYIVGTVVIRQENYIVIFFFNPNHLFGDQNNYQVKCRFFKIQNLNNTFKSMCLYDFLYFCDFYFTTYICIFYNILVLLFRVITH